MLRAQQEVMGRRVTRRVIFLDIDVDEGKQFYVRRIEFQGNTTTRDEVIRREFRQFEGSWYDGNKIKLSRDRVDRLGYFSDVSVDTVSGKVTIAAAPGIFHALERLALVH